MGKKTFSGCFDALSLATLLRACSNTVHLSKKEPWELRAVRGCLGLTLGRRVMHGTSIQTPAERWSYRRRVGHGDFGTNLSYGSGARDFAAARQSQSEGTRTSGPSDGLLRDGFGNVDGSQLPGGVAVFADGRALVAGE